MAILVSLFVGLIFGLGLIVSGMSNPSKVIGFLDLAGNWDPSLAMVIVGALVIGLPAFRFASHRTTSVLGMPMQLPTGKRIDSRLVLGSAMFGVGWGLSGICPGPAVVLAATDLSKGITFMFAMLAGMSLFELQQCSRRRSLLA